MTDFSDVLCDKVQYNQSKTDIYSTNIWKCFHTFIKNNKLDSNEKTIIISLSGGVDSMVFLHLCIVYKKLNSNFKFGVVHINWNQRLESTRESDFLLYHINKYNILHIFECIDNISRNENREHFESKSRQLRFHLYKKVIKLWDGDSVFLGHHQGDIIENVFTNMITGTHLLDLGKMKEMSIIDDVQIVRPFLTISKTDIYELAINEHVPYFKDTTPAWSNRGAIRNTIFPAISSQFGIRYETGLLNMATKSRELGQMVITCLIEPYIKRIVKISENELQLPFEPTYPLIFYEIMFEKVMYANNQPKIKNKTLTSWYNYVINTPKWKSYTMGKNCNISFNPEEQMLLAFSF